MSSNGLASGNHLAGGHQPWSLRGRSSATPRPSGRSASEARRRTRLDLDTVDDPGCRAVLERYARAGIASASGR